MASSVGQMLDHQEMRHSSKDHLKNLFLVKIYIFLTLKIIDDKLFYNLFNFYIF